jgi:hypothetical protein
MIEGQPSLRVSRRNEWVFRVNRELEGPVRALTL